MYQDDELLMLSGIQHIAFCERQWALIHIEQQWGENVLTVEGHHLHERADDPFESESRGNTLIMRSVQLVSRNLGLYGRADVVELNRTDDTANTIEIKEKSGKWKIVPVEYKRGKPKPDECDEVQLCAQALCLEEMHQISIDKGYLYYGQTRHRHQVLFDVGLRGKTIQFTLRMHELYNAGKTPLAEYKSYCRSCSLIDICMPKTTGKNISVNQYLSEILKK
jgi:CRISPR-associated exonuclease Cas4